LYHANRSKKRRIQTLECVVQQGQWACDDAKVLLIAIYKKEKRFPEVVSVVARAAGEISTQLSLQFWKLRIVWLRKQRLSARASKTKAAEGMESEAVSTFETMLHERAAAGAAPRSGSKSRILNGIVNLTS